MANCIPSWGRDSGRAFTAVEFHSIHFRLGTDPMATEGKRPWRTVCSAERTNWGAAGQDHAKFPNLIEDTLKEKWDMIKAKGKCALGTGWLLESK